MFVPGQDLHLPISFSRATDDSVVSHTVFEGERILMFDGGAANAGGVRDATLGDIYRISPSAAPLTLRGRVLPDGHTIMLTPDTEWGTPGEAVIQRRMVTVMNETAQCCDVLVWSVVDSNGVPSKNCIVPLGPVHAGEAYTIIAACAVGARDKTALMRASAVAEGTMIAIPDGETTPVEDLRAGDLVETARGARRLRWIGTFTVRASGPFAPIRVRQHVDHRSLWGAASERVTGFLTGASKSPTTAALSEVRVMPQTPVLRPAASKASTEPTLIPAVDLTENARSAPDAFEFIDYHTLLFDMPEVIYANGIGIESLRVSPVTLALLPPSVLSGIGTAL